MLLPERKAWPMVKRLWRATTGTPPPRDDPVFSADQSVPAPLPAVHFTVAYYIRIHSVSEIAHDLANPPLTVLDDGDKDKGSEFGIRSRKISILPVFMLPV